MNTILYFKRKRYLCLLNYSNEDDCPGHRDIDKRGKT